LPTRRVMIVAGGGAASDLVRKADALDDLGEERCHWLALRALKFTAHVLADRLRGGCVIEAIEDRTQAWRRGETPVLDLHAFALADEARPDHLPHVWAVTSDSLAVRVAMVAKVPELILLKSCDAPQANDWIEAARRGVVDLEFSSILAAAGSGLRVTILNFRQWQVPVSSAVVPPGNAP
jgi:aspartokinase-like uncharacterized kinase